MGSPPGKLLGVQAPKAPLQADFQQLLQQRSGPLGGTTASDKEKLGAPSSARVVSGMV